MQHAIPPAPNQPSPQAQRKPASLWRRPILSDPFRLRPLHLLAVDLLLTLLAYGLFLRPRYAPDSFLYLFDASQFPIIYMNAGRPVSAALVWLGEAAGLGGVSHQLVYTVLMLVFMALGAWGLSLMILRELPSVDAWGVTVVQAATLLTFVNVFMVDFFAFPEVGMVMGHAVFLVTVAVGCFLLPGRIWPGVLSFFFLMLSMGIYQVFYVFFVVYALLLVLLRQDFAWNRKTVWQGARVLAIVLAAIIATQLLAKWIESAGFTMDPRRAVFLPDRYLRNLKQIYHYQTILWKDTYHMLPDYSTLGYLAAMLALLVYSARARGKGWVGSVLLVLMALAGCYVLLYAPHLVSYASWMPQRTMIGYFGLFALAAVPIVKLSRRKGPIILAAALSVIYLALNVWTVQNIAMDQFITNALDKEYCLAVNRAIAVQEQAQGEKATKLALCYDSSGQVFYEDFIEFYTHDTNRAAKGLDWVIPYAIDFYGNTRRVLVDMDPDIYAQRFEGRNWDAFAPEQVYVQGDTAYLCVY